MQHADADAKTQTPITVFVSQRQQKAAKGIETRFFHRWRATTVFQKLTAEAQAPGIAPDASLEYSALY
ncbi:hypothetical protein LA080_001342 [Diaporthe eres]|nr:hypothetical protein LA080_001342 [Diaporthe eres]